GCVVPALLAGVSFRLALLALGAIGFVIVLNTIASFPARTAARLRVVEALRSE
ncbi:MAG: hypothetical protein QOJ66_2790, partial [Ilumatobacteraceae bacterium]